MTDQELLRTPATPDEIFISIKRYPLQPAGTELMPVEEVGETDLSIKEIDAKMIIKIGDLHD